ncbi:MAG: hypothetical protein ACOYYF_12870 [Chloroflexota bacterium]|jgi:hypothetical protein
MKSDFVLILLAAAVILGVAELVVTEPCVVQGQVVALEHTAGSNSSSVGVANDMPIVVTTNESEKWTLFLVVDGRIKAFDVPPDVYYSVKVGDSVELSCRKGKVWGIVSCRSAQLRTK